MPLSGTPASAKLAVDVGFQTDYSAVMGDYNGRCEIDGALRDRHWQGYLPVAHGEGLTASNAFMGTATAGAIEHEKGERDEKNGCNSLWLGRCFSSLLRR